MDRGQFTIRTLPNLIRIEEYYQYFAKVSGVQQTKLETTPHGHINVSARYNGVAHSRTTGQSTTLESQSWPHIWLGTLRCHHYDSTNLHRLQIQGFERDLLPLNISAQDLRRRISNPAKPHNLHLSQSYEPNEPNIPPVQITLEVYDEEDLQIARITGAEQDRWYTRHRPDDRPQLDQQLAEEIQQQIGLERSLILRFRIVLRLPANIGGLIDGHLPAITRMALRWPISTPYRLVNVGIHGGYDAKVIYNPEGGVIEWSHVPFSPVKSETSLGLNYFVSGPIDITLREPGEIYHQARLSGEFDVYLSGTLSGLELSYLDYAGKTVNAIPLETTTHVRTNFSVRLSESFENKYFTPQQHLQFPGVVFDHMRRADLLMLLKDNGFVKTKEWPLDYGRHMQVAGDRQDSDDSAQHYYMIEAVRAEGSRELVLWVLIQDFNRYTTRQKEIQGNEVYITRYPTGNSVIYIRGRLQGDSRRVVQEVNKIQRQLKQLFHHVGLND